MISSDAVFNVTDIELLGRQILLNADVIEIKNARHDVVLSADE